MKHMVIAGAAAVVLVITSAYAATQKWVHADGECGGSSGTVWSESKLYHVNADGSLGGLICSMGVGCNGKAWNTCNVQGGGEDDPIRPYYDAAYGDSIRLVLGDPTNHITEFTAEPELLSVTCDVIAYYRVFSLITGAMAFEELTPVQPGNEKVIALPGLASGPYMVIAYHPGNNLSVGYMAFRQ